MPAFAYGGRYSVSHTKALPFLFALGSPFPSAVSAALSPSAALCKAGYTGYLLFFNGLNHYSAGDAGLSSLLRLPPAGAVLIKECGKKHSEPMVK